MKSMESDEEEKAENESKIRDLEVKTDIVAIQNNLLSNNPKQHEIMQKQFSQSEIHFKKPNLVSSTFKIIDAQEILKNKNLDEFKGPKQIKDKLISKTPKEEYSKDTLNFPSMETPKEFINESIEKKTIFDVHNANKEQKILNEIKILNKPFTINKEADESKEVNQIKFQSDFNNDKSSKIINHKTSPNSQIEKVPQNFQKLRETYLKKAKTENKSNNFQIQSITKNEINLNLLITNKTKTPENDKFKNDKMKLEKELHEISQAAFQEKQKMLQEIANLNHQMKELNHEKADQEIAVEEKENTIKIVCII